MNLRGTNDKLTETSGLRSSEQARASFGTGLRIRFALARLTGGCVYVPHAPNPRFGPALDSAYAAIARGIAAETSCDYVDAFKGVWTRGQATRWTTDGSHPTADGYKRLATALARSLASRGELR